MKIAQINAITEGSTGRIMFQISDIARKHGHTVKTFSGRTFSIRPKKLKPAPPEHKYFGTWFENGIHYCFSQFLGYHGFYSVIGTLQLVSSLKKFKPDIVHLHNLHGFCINLPILFDYFKKSGVRIIWTLHDCWSFTGHCPNFDMIECKKWVNGCCDCSQYKLYPKSRVDTSAGMYKKKKKIFTSAKNIDIITPSEWLSGLVKKSFLKDFKVTVINNGIDLTNFKYYGKNFPMLQHLNDKHVVLGVAFGWGERKGIDVFVELSKRLRDDYAIVLVGVSDELAKTLPKNIVTIPKTDSQTELAKIYSFADVFVNPTREDNFPTVNIESLACGTPVVTFDSGGSGEIPDKCCGIVVEKNDIDALEKAIYDIVENKPFSPESCIARAGSFDLNERFKEYIELYENSTHST